VRFLEVGEVEAWCDEHDIVLVEGEVRVASDPRLTHAVRTLYANGQRSGREPAVAAAAVRALGDWDECLLWVTLVGVWPSTEDWPAYYALRGAEGERRSLETAPGHWFDGGERAKLERFLTAVMQNGWNAFALPARAGQPTDVRLCVSHDEWAELQAREPVEFAPPAV
jgi:hypothetical protein